MWANNWTKDNPQLRFTTRITARPDLSPLPHQRRIETKSISRPFSDFRSPDTPKNTISLRIPCPASTLLIHSDFSLVFSLVTTEAPADQHSCPFRSPNSSQKHERPGTMRVSSPRHPSWIPWSSILILGCVCTPVFPIQTKLLLPSVVFNAILALYLYSSIPSFPLHLLSIWLMCTRLLSSTAACWLWAWAASAWPSPPMPLWVLVWTWWLSSSSSSATRPFTMLERLSPPRHLSAMSIPMAKSPTLSPLCVRRTTMSSAWLSVS